MDETPPDGSAATLAQVAATLQPLTTPAAVFLILACGSAPGALLLLGLLAWATYHTTADARPATRSRLRGLLLVALASLPAAVLLPEALPQVAAPEQLISLIDSALVAVWGLYWLSMWRFARRRILDAAIRRRVDRGFLPTAAVLLLAVLVPWLIQSPDLASMLALLGGASMLLAGRAVRAVSAVWPLAKTRPSDFLDATDARLRADFGLEGDGGVLAGQVSGMDVSVCVDVSTVPSVTTIRTTLGATPPGLRIRARRPGETGGQPLADPLLGQLLFIEGVSDAALLAGLHEDLLGVLHGWPGSVLEDGRLTVRIPGPPFDAARLGEAPVPDDADALATFLAQRVGEAAALARALHGRSCARGTARRHQAQRTPERG